MTELHVVRHPDRNLRSYVGQRAAAHLFDPAQCHLSDYTTTQNSHA